MRYERFFIIIKIPERVNLIINQKVFYAKNNNYFILKKLSKFLFKGYSVNPLGAKAYCDSFHI